MKNKRPSVTAKYSQLRVDAENALKGHPHEKPVEGRDAEVLFQELQVHQIELEKQNDELRVANEDLELQRLKFASIYDLAPVGYFILNRAGLIEEVNTAGRRLLGLERSQIIQKRLHAFVASEHSDSFYVFLGRLLTSGEKLSCQLKFNSLSGREIYTQVEGIAIQQASQCYIAVVDISESIKFRQDIAESNDRLELALEAAMAGTWELDISTMKFHLDEFNCHLCNINESDFAGTYQSFIDLVYPEDKLMVDQHFRTAINSENELDIVCRILHAKNHICYVNIRGHMHEKSSGEKSFIGIMMDITDKKQSEIEANLLRQNQQKTITTAILTAEENERKRISETLHDSVSQLLYGVKIHLNQLNDTNRTQVVGHLNELLDMAIKETRNISFELRPAILADFGLPAAIEELVQRISAPQFKIVLHISGFTKNSDLALSTNIFRVVQELVNNCMKHSRADLVKIDIRKNKNVKIEVVDNGRGFDPKELDTRPKGAGFSSIKNRISLYNGSLHIDSSPGKGTSVKIELHL